MLRMTIAFAAALGLSACGEREVILPGERLDPLAVTSPDGPAVVGPAGVSSTALNLAAPRVNGEWTHRGGNAAHQPGHVALGAGTNRVWSNAIGQGNDRRFRISADPVVAAGRVFTLDSHARVTATALSGGPHGPPMSRRSWKARKAPRAADWPMRAGGSSSRPDSANWSHWMPPAVPSSGGNAWMRPWQAVPPCRTASSMSSRATISAGRFAPATARFCGKARARLRLRV